MASHVCRLSDSFESHCNCKSILKPAQSFQELEKYAFPTVNYRARNGMYRRKIITDGVMARP